MKYKNRSRSRKIIKDLLVILVFILIIYMFYKSIFAFILLPPAVIIYMRYSKKQSEQQRKRQIASQFKDALISITAAVRAGYSIENSIKEARAEMEQVFGKDSIICTELDTVIKEIYLGIPAEEAFDNFAARTEVEDIATFTSVFRIAKRGGGDMVEIIRKTTDDITAKIDTDNEISVLISSKKLEQTIMSFMPLGILIYIDLASADLLAPLYGNLPGVVIMTVCLIIYIFAYFLSRKLMHIEV